jgi:hypothetical protein
MAEKICNLLKLDIKAGLGRRLAKIEVKQDAKDSKLFYIFPKDDVVEALMLAHALSVRAQEILLDVHFRPARILACQKS